MVKVSFGTLKNIGQLYSEVVCIGTDDCMP